MADILDKKEKYGLVINLHDFGQGKFEKYQTQTMKAAQDAFFQLSANGQGVQASAVIRGETVRSALRLGIISGIEMKQIDDMKPYIVQWIADEVRAHVASVVSEPADPNS